MASDLGLYCLSISLLWDARNNWLRINHVLVKVIEVTRNISRHSLVRNLNDFYLLCRCDWTSSYIGCN